MTKFELRAQIALKKNDAFKVLEVIDSEQRALTAEEEAKYNELLEEIKELEAKMNEVEENEEDKEEEVETPKEETPAEETPTEEPTQETEETPTEETPTEETPSEEEDEEKNKENRNITMKNFVNEIRSAVAEKRNVTMPLFEKRDTISVTANGHGENGVVMEDLIGVEGALRADNILSKFKTIPVNKNDGSFVLYSGASAQFVGENDGIEAGEGDFQKITFAPKTLMAMIEVSNKFLANTDATVEAMLKQDLLDAITDKLQETILGDGEGDTNTPKGVLNGAEEATIDYAKVCELEEALENANVKGYEWICSPSVKSALKQTSISGGKSDVRMVYADNEIDGVPATVTSNCAGLVAIDPSKYGIAYWAGSAKLLVDVYSKADKDITRLICTMYVDAQPIRTEAVKGVKKA